MKKHTNDECLIKKGINQKYILLYQVWKELTDYRTLDSYQYRIMNSLSAIRELVEVLDNRLKMVNKSNQNINECKAETLGIIKGDIIINKYYYSLGVALKNHLSKKTETEKEIKALRYCLVYLYDSISNGYFEKLVDELEISIENGNEREIIDRANRVVSNCVTRGWSSMALYDVVDILIESNNDSQKWITFKELLLKNYPEQYTVLIPLKVRVTSSKVTHEFAEKKLIENIQSMGMRVLTDEDIKRDYCFISDISLESKYLEVNNSAFDYFTASHDAFAKYANIMNIFSFYGIIEAWSIKEISCFVVNKEKSNYKHIGTKDIYGTYTYLEGANETLKKSLLLLMKNDTFGAKLNATYSYANVSKASYSIEEKFINMWVALESLCRSDAYDNIIINLKEIVPAALCNRYAYRKYRNFAEDCRRCGVNYDFSTKEFQINHPDKKLVVKNVIEIFNNDTLYNELLDKCKVNSLLKNRCVELHDQTIDKNKMIETIFRHHSNVSQQLSRLYRKRNSIAHTASLNDVQTVRYIEHLEDYLYEFVTEIVLFAENNNIDQIEIINEMIRDNYLNFEYLAKEKKNNISLEQGLYSTGIIDLV